LFGEKASATANSRSDNEETVRVFISMRGQKYQSRTGREPWQRRTVQQKVGGASDKFDSANDVVDALAHHAGSSHPDQTN
jgi:hypothetical protein